jgi:hypothetical protein
LPPSITIAPGTTSVLKLSLLGPVEQPRDLFPGDDGLLPTLGPLDHPEQEAVHLPVLVGHSLLEGVEPPSDHVQLVSLSAVLGDDEGSLVVLGLARQHLLTDDVKSSDPDRQEQQDHQPDQAPGGSGNP